MRLQMLRLRRFTTFEDVELDLSKDINVLLGENGTGKSHVLKLAYVLNEARRHHGRGGKLVGIDAFESIEQAVETLLSQTFMPDDLGRLVRRGVGRRSAHIEAQWSDGSKLTAKLSSLGRLTGTLLASSEEIGRSIFLPTREVLSMFPGFTSAWEARESSVDRTYYDLCKALDARPLRGSRDAFRRQLLEPIEEALQGEVALHHGKFYVRLQSGDMEAPLVAEGLRKLAMLAYLVVNGALSNHSFLFWDEPETSLNPKLANLVAKVTLGLAESGVQIFMATHGYALASELSLQLRSRVGLDGKFVGLFPTAHGVEVEFARRAELLRHNAILESLAELHDRELQVEEAS